MRIERFQPGQEEELSRIIRRTLLEVSAGVDPQWEVDWLYEHYSPEGIAEMAAQGHTYVVWEDGKIVGTGTVTAAGEDESEIIAAFLAPEAIGRGLGAELFAALEADPLAANARRLWLTTSVMARGFYERQGYGYVSGYRQRSEDGLCYMEKFPAQRG